VRAAIRPIIDSSQDSICLDTVGSIGGLAIEEKQMRTLKLAAIAASTLAGVTMFSPNWSGQGGLSLSTSQAEARARVYIRTGYAASATYYTPTGLSWYAVRAYYNDGPWSGPGYSYTGWDDYARVTGIGCTPGTTIKGGDGILYVCQ
jgi:hypothetical protein